MEKEELVKKVNELGPWFHNIELPHGISTNPDDPYNPVRMWSLIKYYLDDLRGKSVLDIGCCSGFFEVELEKLGARTAAFDNYEKYVSQTRLVKDALSLGCKVLRADIENDDTLRGYLDPKYDVVFMLGVIYHLENPIKGLMNSLDMTEEYLIIETAFCPDENSVAYFMDYDGEYVYTFMPSVKCLHRMISYCGGKIVQEGELHNLNRYVFKVVPGGPRGIQRINE